MEDSLRIEGVRTAQELIQLFMAEMERKGILPDTEEIRIKQLREKALAKRWLKVSDIEKAQLWGDLSKAGILAILKKLPESEVRFDTNRKKPYYEVSKNVAKIVAEERGII
jgi:hypothetical protein